MLQVQMFKSTSRVSLPRDRRLNARNAALHFKEDSETMLTTETLEKTLSLLDEGYTYPSITEEIGIIPEEAAIPSGAV